MSGEVLSYAPPEMSMGRVVVPEGGLMTNQQPEFNLGEMPLPSIAPLETVALNRADLSVAAHEMKHVLAAQGQFLYVSIIPKDDGSLGRIVFGGNIDMENFHIAAAGSMVRDHLGGPIGTSGDEAILAGTNKELAVLAAGARIKKHPEGIRSNLSKLLAIRREVSSGEFGDLMERAEFEESLKAEGRYDAFVQAYYKKFQGEKASTPSGKMSFSELINSLERCHVIETLEDGYERITNYRWGREINSIIRCVICGGINGAHSQEIHRIYEARTRRPFDGADNDPMRMSEKELVPTGLAVVEDKTPEPKRSGIIFKNPFSKN
jgi:hypothetical protein